mmetsp:Transcript_56092/g.154567  ORF Transcript_56092/g.154567 Transcript_56092/m.154567 type:complete len:479 (+) Transcript_56092:83-1519(+)
MAKRHADEAFETWWSTLASNMCSAHAERARKPRLLVNESSTEAFETSPSPEIRINRGGRGVRACTECRKAKAKCDVSPNGVDPCARCRRLGRKCVYGAWFTDTVVRLNKGAGAYSPPVATPNTNLAAVVNEHPKRGWQRMSAAISHPQTGPSFAQSNMSYLSEVDSAQDAMSFSRTMCDFLKLTMKYVSQPTGPAMLGDFMRSAVTTQDVAQIGATLYYAGCCGYTLDHILTDPVLVPRFHEVLSGKLKLKRVVITESADEDLTKLLLGMEDVDTASVADQYEVTVRPLSRSHLDDNLHHVPHCLQERLLMAAQNEGYPAVEFECQDDSGYHLFLNEQYQKSILSLESAIDFFKLPLEDAMKNMKLFKTEEEQQLFFSLWAKAREVAEVAPSRVCPEDAAAGLSSVKIHRECFTMLQGFDAYMEIVITTTGEVATAAGKKTMYTFFQVSPRLAMNTISHIPGACRGLAALLILYLFKV